MTSKSDEPGLSLKIPKAYIRRTANGKEVVFYEIRSSRIASYGGSGSGGSSSSSVDAIASKVITDVTFKRFSDFVTLDAKIHKNFPDLVSLPSLPPKKVFGNLDPRFVEKRREQLEAYLCALVAHAGPVYKLPSGDSNALSSHNHTLPPTRLTLTLLQASEDLRAFVPRGYLKEQQSSLLRFEVVEVHTFGVNRAIVLLLSPTVDGTLTFLDAAGAGLDNAASRLTVAVKDVVALTEVNDSHTRATITFVDEVATRLALAAAGAGATAGGSISAAAAGSRYAYAATPSTTASTLQSTAVTEDAFASAASSQQPPPHMQTPSAPSSSPPSISLPSTPSLSSSTPPYSSSSSSSSGLLRTRRKTIEFPCFEDRQRFARVVRSLQHRIALTGANTHTAAVTATAIAAAPALSLPATAAAPTTATTATVERPPLPYSLPPWQTSVNSPNTPDLYSSPSPSSSSSSSSTDAPLYTHCSVFCSSWNLAKEPEPSDLSAWIPARGGGYDLLVIGTQECPTAVQALSDAVQRHIGARYSLVAKKALLEMKLLVFCRSELIQCGAIARVETDSVATGLLGVWGNKGAVAAAFKLHNLSIGIVNAHLAPHPDLFHWHERNRMFREIDAAVALTAAGAGVENLDASVRFDVLLYIGDLNYRLDLPHASVVDLSQRRQFDLLFPKDQLRRAQWTQQAFSGYAEGVLQFPPTYKYVMPKKKGEAEKGKGGGGRHTPTATAATATGRHSRNEKDNITVNPLLQSEQSPASTAATAATIATPPPLPDRLLPRSHPPHHPQQQLPAVAEASEADELGSVAAAASPLTAFTSTADSDRAAAFSVATNRPSSSVYSQSHLQTHSTRYASVCPSPSPSPSPSANASESSVVTDTVSGTEEDGQQQQQQQQQQQHEEDSSNDEYGDDESGTEEEEEEEEEEEGEEREESDLFPSRVSPSVSVTTPAAATTAAAAAAAADSASEKGEEEEREEQDTVSELRPHFKRVQSSMSIRSSVVAAPAPAPTSASSPAAATAAEPIYDPLLDPAFQPVTRSRSRVEDPDSLSPAATAAAAAAADVPVVSPSSPARSLSPKPRRSTSVFATSSRTQALVAQLQAQIVSANSSSGSGGNSNSSNDATGHAAAAATTNGLLSVSTAAVNRPAKRSSVREPRRRSATVPGVAKKRFARAYGKTRVPSWCDRILFRTRVVGTGGTIAAVSTHTVDEDGSSSSSNNSGNGSSNSNTCNALAASTAESFALLKLKGYYRCDGVVSSDHIPVCALFDLRVPLYPPITAYSYPCSIHFSSLELDLTIPPAVIPKNNSTSDFWAKIYVAFYGPFLAETARGKRTGYAVVKNADGTLRTCRDITVGSHVPSASVLSTAVAANGSINSPSYSVDSPAAASASTATSAEDDLRSALILASWSEVDLPVLQCTLGAREFIALENVFYVVKSGDQLGGGNDTVLGQGYISMAPLHTLYAPKGTQPYAATVPLAPTTTTEKQLTSSPFPSTLPEGYDGAVGASCTVRAPSIPSMYESASVGHTADSWHFCSLVERHSAAFGTLKGELHVAIAEPADRERKSEDQLIQEILASD